MATSEEPGTPGASGRTWVDTAALIEVFKRLPPLEPERFRRDVDSVFRPARGAEADSARKATGGDLA
jgi:hypothetical protein